MKAPNFTFSFPTPVRISSDLDGIRVFTRQTATLLLPVPAPSKAVLGLGSNEPGALLYGAAVKLEQRSHVAYEFIRSISAEQMPVAVDHCLAAAAHHFDPNVQKLLLKAASMGMRRCGRPYDSDKFVRICRLLRVLNALRLMGTPLTYAQLEHLSTPSVIDRLVALGHWPMAIRLCEFLELEPRDGLYKVLAHWCMAMMVAHKERADGKVEALAQRIVAQLKPYSAIAFADIAKMAARQELPSLATTLLELETNVGRQVTVMLKLKQLEKALQRAAQSQQPDLMHLVLKHLRNSLSGREVELLLRKVPQALSIYQSEIRDEAPERLLALYEQNDDFARQAIHYLQRAEQSQDIFDVTKTTEQLAKAEKALRNMRDGTGAQLVAESAQLVVDNSKREEKFGTSMTHMPVRETFFWAAAHEELAMLEQLRKQHRLSEKQVFLWTSEGFARGGKWPQLEQYGRSRKSPVGYLPVVELCATHGNKNLATRFMDKLAGYEEQVRAYLALGEVKKAATLAVEKSDMQMLQLIRRRFPTTSPHWAEVSKMMENLAKTT